MRRSVIVVLVVSALANPLAQTQEAQGEIRGQALDYRGRPLAGQRIELHGGGRRGDLVTTTDAEGRFLYDRLRQGRYRVMLPAGDQTAAARDVELTGAVMTVTDIVLARPFEFETIKGASPEDVAEYQWTRIRRLKSGTTIFLTVDGSPELKRGLLWATESTLVVRDPKAPRPETVSRADVVQVRAPKDRSGGRKFLGGIAGYFLGGFAGGFLGAIIGSAAGGDDAALGGMVLGMVTGLVTGIAVGVRGGFRRPYEVIYIRRAIARLTQPPSGARAYRAGRSGLPPSADFSSWCPDQPPAPAEAGPSIARRERSSAVMETRIEPVAARRRCSGAS